MKKIIASVMALTLGTSVAMAGGPVVIEEEAEVVAEETPRGLGILPLIAGVVVLALVLGANDDEETTSP